jgi:hypothetical protein
MTHDHLHTVPPPIRHTSLFMPKKQRPFFLTGAITFATIFALTTAMTTLYFPQFMITQAQAQTKTETQVNHMWFKNKNCKSVRIRFFEKMGDEKPAQEALVQDDAVISELMRLIDTLPTRGNMNKKWGEDTPVLVLSFGDEPDQQNIWFFRTSIQTPDTSFFSPSLENEQRAYKLAHAQLK